MNEKVFFMLLTNQCNMLCPHCYNMLDPAKNQNHSEDMFVVKRIPMILDKLVNKGFSKVMFSGGEALLHPNIMDIISEAKKKNLITALFTNGKLLNQDIIKRLEKAGLDEIRISFNELVWTKNNLQYDAIYQNQTRYINELKNAKIGIGFIYVISKNNVDYVIETYKRLLSIGVTMKIQPLYLPEGSKHYNAVSAATIPAHKWIELSEQFKSLDLNREKESDNMVYGKRDEITKYLELLKSVFIQNEKPDYCPTGPILVIDAEGNFHPCLFRHDIICGSAYNDADIEMVVERLNDYLYFKDGVCYREECLSAYR